MSVVSQVPACGPDFPNAYLTNSLSEVSVLPTLSFEHELERVLKTGGRPLRSEEEELAASSRAELAEIREALLAEHVASDQIDGLVQHYARTNPPRELPPEFLLYAEGAAAWHRGEAEEAVAAWRRVLALPPAHRHYRTVWAAYMIGRALCDTQPEQARAALQMARKAAHDGFADSQNLVMAALGWEARTFWREGDCGSALTLYARQFELGVPSAKESLQLTLQWAFQGSSRDWQTAVAANETAPKERPASDAPATAAGARCDDAESDGRGVATDWQLQAIAADRTLRQIVTAWFGSRGGPAAPWSRGAEKDFGRWLRSIGGVKDLDPAEADRWSWAAYQHGYWEEARTLVQRAPAEAPAAEWVRAMLLLRGGFVADAANHLATAARTWSRDEALANVRSDREGGDWRHRIESQPLRDSPADQLAGVRGVLALRSEHYVEALRLFVTAGHWDDAAYMAERVLTIDELRTFVDAEEPDTGASTTSNTEHANVRHLLARRLVRAGRFDEALAYFPAALRSTYREYLDAVRLGFDAKAGPDQRADALWKAAQIERDQGMELRGTELAPDFFTTGGGFSWPDIASVRVPAADRSEGDTYVTNLGKALAEGTLAPTPGELERLALTPVPTRRFHYRYRAAELGWLAASLLPNDDEQTARILNTSGRWIASRDPEQARLYYRTLVVRCPHTAIGRRANEKHWFIDAD